MRDSVKGSLMVAVATLGWSLSGMFVRALPRLDSWTINAFRGINMALALMIWIFLRYRKNAITIMRTPDKMAMFWFAFFFVLGTSMYIMAIQLANVAAVASLGATSALFAAVIGRLWLGEKTSSIFYIAILLAIAGVIFIAKGESSQSSTGLLGSIIALGVALAFAIQSAALRKYRDIPMEPAYVYGGLTVFLSVFLLHGIMQPTWQEYGILLAMGAFQLAIPGVFYLKGAKYVTAVQMVLISMMDTFLNPLWVWLLVGEEPTKNTFYGAVFILVAILATTFLGQAKPNNK